MSRLHCRCRSTGSIWVGGGPLDTYNVVPSYGFEGGVDYGYINSCSSGGCAGGGCSDGGCNGGGGEVYSDGGVIGEPVPATQTDGAVMDGGYQDGGYQDVGTVEGPFEGNGH